MYTKILSIQKKETVSTIRNHRKYIIIIIKLKARKKNLIFTWEQIDRINNNIKNINIIIILMYYILCRNGASVFCCIADSIII